MKRDETVFRRGHITMDVRETRERIAAELTDVRSAEDKQRQCWCVVREGNTLCCE